MRGTQAQGAVAIVAPGGSQAGRIGRRNLTPEAKRDRRGQRYTWEKPAVGAMECPRIYSTDLDGLFCKI
jgi:hypothetical protein